MNFRRMINSNVFKDKKLDREKSVFIWMKWGEDIELRDAISNMEETFDNQEAERLEAEASNVSPL